MVQPSPLSDYHMSARHAALMSQADHARLVRDARTAQRSGKTRRNAWAGMVAFVTAALRRTKLPEVPLPTVEHQPVQPAVLPLS